MPLVADAGFALDAGALLARVDENTKLVFVCSPNNPTANAVPAAAAAHPPALAPRALLVVDEAYVDFAAVESLCRAAGRSCPDLAILKTLSKAHGLAGARVGALIAAPEVIALARKVIPPYAITELTVESGCAAAASLPRCSACASAWRSCCRNARGWPRASPARRCITKVWPSDANFLLVDSTDPDEVLARVRRAGLIIRDVRQPALPRSLRISVGTPEQNDRVLESLE